MSPTALSAAALLAGLVAVAAALYALQRLRVRHESRTVVTSLFWREATEETRARSLFERFRHPLAYAMALLCAGLLWLGAGRLDGERADGTRHVFLLDASAGMGRDAGSGTRFDLAVDALEAELADAPRDRTEVLWCGAHVRTLLARGEDRSLLRPRLAGRLPDPAPASVERALRSRSAEADGATRFVVVGDAPLTDEALPSPDGTDRLERLPLEAATSGGRGITALGVSEPASGAWGTVDVMVEVRGPTAQDAELSLTLGGEPLARPTAQDRGGAGRRFLVADVPARGGLLEARLAGADDLQADDVASLSLPDRPPIRVAIAGAGDGWSSPVRAALEADPAVQLVAGDAEADVVVAAGPTAGRPTLAFVSPEEQLESILIGHDPGTDSRTALERAVGELGLDRVDASALAEALGRPLSVGAAPSASRSVSLWSELVDPARTSFLESRAFPVLVGRSVRWLADVPELTAYRAAGRLEPRPVSAGVASDPLASIVRAGPLLDPDVTAPRAAALELPEPASEGAGPWRPYTWVLLIALAALCAEWALHQRGRMP